MLDRLDAFLCNQGHAWGKTYSGVGDGTLTDYAGKAASVAEMITIEATSVTNFTVTGSVTGALAAATVGTPYASSVVDFTLTAGGTAFEAGDTFTLQTTPAWERMRYDGCLGASYQSGANWDAGSTNNYTKAFDHTNSHARSLGVPASLSVEMYRAVAVTNFNLSCGDSTTITPKDITLQYSDNGTAWSNLQSWTGLVWTTVQERKQFAVTSPESHRYWRINFTAAQTGQTTVRVTEWEIFSNATHEWELEDRFEFAWKAPGLDGSQEILVGGYDYQDQATNIHNLNFVGCRFWDTKKRITDQQNNSGAKVLALNNQNFTYWFVANGQRVIVVAVPTSTYSVGYFGFGLPFEPPSIHKFPHIIGAVGDNFNLSLATSTPDNRSCFNPGPNGLAAYYPDNAWRQHTNRVVSTGSDGSTNTSEGKVYPWAFRKDGTLLDYIRDQVDGGFPLIPGMIVFNVSPVAHVFGEFDGLYYVTGFNNSAGTLIDYGGFDHLVVQNAARTNPQDYAAIRLD